MPIGPPARLAAVLAIAVLAAGCAAPPSPVPSAPTPAPSPSPSQSPAASTAESCAQRTLDGLNEGQRVGQLLLLGLAGDALGPAERDAITSDHIGSVWFSETSQAGIAGIRDVANAVQALAPGPVGGSAFGRIGLFIAANQEGGLVQALRGTGFSRIPSALTQGGLAAATLQADAKTWGGQLKTAGINLDFAPVADVVPAGTDASNQPIGALQREYGHDPATAGGHAAAFIRGMAAAGILTVAKHFPGLGRVKGNTDFTAGVVDRTTTATDPSLGSFRTAIGAGVPIVMVALATYTRIDPNRLAAFSPIVIGDLLRTKLGFSGLVMSDDLGATAAVATISPATRAIDFIAAGGEMIISKTVGPAIAMAVGITARASSDPAFRAQVNAAALHVLALKEQAHLLSCASP